VKYFYLSALALSLASSSFSQTLPFGPRAPKPETRGFVVPGTVNGEGSGVGHIVSSSSSLGGPFNGLSIGQVVGANRFYSLGYTGSRAIAANIEAGEVWKSHETLTHSTVSLSSTHPSLVGTRIGEADRHATWVGHNLAGRGANEYQRGIAYGATLWSGGIASSYVGAPWSNSFNWANGHAFIDPYRTAMLTGVSGQTADVINSSWGGSGSAFNAPANALDAMIRQSGKTFVASAGNSGPGANTIGWPGSGHNAITVGALGPDTGNYQTITSFSSRGPSNYNGPDGSVTLARARVDITAPGQNMTLAFYGGVTGGNFGGTASGAPDFYSPNVAGTSFAAPTVAGGAALIVDAGKDRFGGGDSIDGRLVKSILLTSAAKPIGWNNGQALSGSTISTTQALDFTYGAGRLDLNQAFDVYTGGTTNVAGNGGGNVLEQGWDVGEITQGGSVDYMISPELLVGSTFTTTLNWFVNAGFQGTTAAGGINTTADSFTNLGLEIWRTNAGSPTTLVAESRALFISTQHLNFNLDSTGTYMMRVKWLGERYDFVGNSSERFALSWRGTAAPVPEPATMATLALGIGVLARRRRQTK